VSRPVKGDMIQIVDRKGPIKYRKIKDVSDCSPGDQILVTDVDYPGILGTYQVHHLDENGERAFIAADDWEEVP
jgi:hypothetical protein